MENYSFTVSYIDNGSLLAKLLVLGQEPGHISTFDMDWLKTHSYIASNPNEESSSSRGTDENSILWDDKILKNQSLEVPYDQIIHSESGLFACLLNIEKFGLCLIPEFPTDNPINAVKLLADQIGIIRNTHYGDIFDVQSDFKHKDASYSSKALRIHTDNTYFTDPAGLQVIHVIERNGEGGVNTFIDGFHAAKILKSRDPESYRILSESYISGIYHDFNITPIIPYPIFNHHPMTNQLYQIRYNNDDRNTLMGIKSQKDIRNFYKALKAWDGILMDEKNTYSKCFFPGTAFLFDNYRIVHGRSAFTGCRRFVGCYFYHDDYRAKLRKLKQKEKTCKAS